MEPKKAILLNYGMMLDDIGKDMKEHTDFMHHFFTEELNHDPDLLAIAFEFQAFCESLKRLDTAITQRMKKNGF